MSHARIRRSLVMTEVVLPAAELGEPLTEKWQRTPDEERIEVKGYEFGLFRLGEPTPFEVVPNMSIAKAHANDHRRRTGEGVEVRDMKTHTFYYKVGPKLMESAPEGFPTKRPFDKVLLAHGFKVDHPDGVVSPNRFNTDPKHDVLTHRWTNPSLGSKTHVETWLYRNGEKTWVGRFEQPNGIMSPSTGDTAPQLDRAIAYWEKR